jgi:biotin carboxyl carrier protein
VAREVVEVPVAGKILSVNVKVGDSVKEDDLLCVLESMKMENPIVAPVSGKVVEVGVTPGTAVESGKLIAVIEH